jgi:DNA-binding SARP family transcriptional activator
MGAYLHFRMLGSFAVGCGDTWHPGPPPKKGREFIQYLAAYPRRVATVEELAEAFWPDCTDDVRHRIHLASSGARSFLRRLLNGVDALRYTSGGYVWDPGVEIESDAEQFLERSRSGTVADYRAAVELYRGEFLAGETADWLQPMRVRLATERASGLAALAERAYGDGDYARALSFGLELVGAERGHESGTRLVMRSFAGLGHRARALEQYARLKQYLERQIGVEPAAETAQLARDVVQLRTA